MLAIMAVLLARLNKIVLFDVNKSKIDQINEGTSTIDEEPLKIELKRNLKNISASQFNKDAVLKSDFIILAVPTNYDDDSGQFDTKQLEGFIPNKQNFKT